MSSFPWFTASQEMTIVSRATVTPRMLIGLYMQIMSSFQFGLFTRLSFLALKPETISRQSQSYVTSDCQSASLSGCQASSGAKDQIFITVRQLRVCWCGAPSLTRGWVCRLQFLLALTSVVILGSESRGTHGHILLSQIRDSRNPEC
jgi:hypothetical protein